MVVVIFMLFLILMGLGNMNKKMNRYNRTKLK